MNTEEDGTKPAITRVRDSERRKIEAGGMLLPQQVLDATTADALRTLVDDEYAQSRAGCVAKAIVEASKRLKKAKGRTQE